MIPIHIINDDDEDDVNFLIRSEVASLKHQLQTAQTEAAEQKRTAETLHKLTEAQKEQLHALMCKQLQSTNTESSQTASNVEEVQHANDQLLRQVAELQTQLEEKSATQVSHATTEQIAVLKEELERMQTAQAEQKRMTDTIAKQRDMYKTLLAEKDAELLKRDQPESTLHTTYTQLVQQAAEAKQALQTAKSSHQKEMDALRRQIAQTETELRKAEQAIETERVCVRQAHEAVERQQGLVATLEEKAEQMEKEATRLQTALASKQVEVNQEREKVCQTNDDDDSQ